MILFILLFANYILVSQPLIPNRLRGAVGLKRRGEQAKLAGLPKATVFALCGGRLKVLP